jgi:cytochrome c-type biogenesis protein CcmF
LVVGGSIGLLAWRGDLLRSPGSIRTPVSREGAFLANNFLFGAFALVVLLGTVFPLIAQAINGDQITVGSPYFDRMTMPIVVCILFLMAVAPVLPWRQASPGLVRTRLFWPAAIAVATLVACVIGGVRGLNPLLAFGLGAFAGTSALRQLFVEVRRRGLPGFSGPSGGGMVVHVGVVLIAVAYAASHSYSHSAQLTLAPGQTAAFDGHTFTYNGTRNVAASTHTALEALVRIDHGPTYTPALSDYPFASEAIGTPSVKSSLTEDIYLTIQSSPAKPGGPVVIGAIVEPMVAWIWLGGGVILAGTALSAWPGRRRPAGSSRAPRSRRAERAPAAAVESAPVPVDGLVADEAPVRSGAGSSAPVSGGLE